MYLSTQLNIVKQLQLQLIVYMSKKQHNNVGINQSSAHHSNNLQNLTTEQLRGMLRQLETEHDIFEAKNEQLATHISDLRAVVQKVEKQKEQELNYTIQKKKKLQDQIERYNAALKVAHSQENTMFVDMLTFKQISQGK